MASGWGPEMAVGLMMIPPPELKDTTPPSPLAEPGARPAAAVPPVAEIISCPAADPTVSELPRLFTVTEIVPPLPAPAPLALSSRAPLPVTFMLSAEREILPPLKLPAAVPLPAASAESVSDEAIARAPEGAVMEMEPPLPPDADPATEIAAPEFIVIPPPALPEVMLIVPP